MPTARLVAGLEDVQVYDGEDAVFSLDLSTIIQGTWFLNGEELESNEPEGQVEPGALRYRIEQKGPQHRLLLQAVRHQHSGALIGFSCPGVQDSAALTIQGWCWWGPGWIQKSLVGSDGGLSGPEGHFPPTYNVRYLQHRSQILFVAYRIPSHLLS